MTLTYVSCTKAGAGNTMPHATDRWTPAAVGTHRPSTAIDTRRHEEPSSPNMAVGATLSVEQGGGGGTRHDRAHAVRPDRLLVPFGGVVRGGGGGPPNEWGSNAVEHSGGSTPELSALLCDIPSGCCSFTGPWTVTCSPLRMLRRVAAFCRPLRPVLLLVSFPRSRSPVVGALELCWMWQDVPFARQRRPIIGVLGVVLVVAGVV